MPTDTSSHIRLTCPLFIPGNRADMLAKVKRFNPSAFIPDLEDSVQDANKDEALEVTANAIPDLVATGKPIIPRINSIASGRTRRELEGLIGAGIAAVSIGKIQAADDILHLDAIMSEIESDCGMNVCKTGILPWIESAAAVVNAHEICAASSRVRWVAFGAEDYAADMGITRDADDPHGGSRKSAEAYGEPALLFPRSTVAVAARAAGIQALDTPFTKFRDPDGLHAEAELARKLGYSGKFAIHPDQIQTIKQTWKPTKAEIQRAEAVLTADEEARTQGRGATSIDGEMIDAPVVARAKNLLAQAQELAE